MIVSKQKNSKIKIILFGLVIGFITLGGTAGASQVSAFLDGSSTSKKTTTLTARGDSTGNIYVTNSGANTNTQGYAKRPVIIFPDTTVASSGWLTPGTADRVTFSQVEGRTYYGQITGQTVGSRGGVSITVY